MDSLGLLGMFGALRSVRCSAYLIDEEFLNLFSRERAYDA